MGDGWSGSLLPSLFGVVAFLALVVTFALLVLSLWLLWRRARGRELRALARDLGLTFQWRGSVALLTGQWDGSRVSWRYGRDTALELLDSVLGEESESKPDERWWTEWRVDGQGIVPHKLVLRSHLMPTSDAWSFGDPALGVAALDSQTRSRLAALQTSGVSVAITAGTALARTPHLVDDQRAVRQTFTDLVRLVRGLAFKPADAPQRLARHAHEDPDGEWRLRSLLCLQDSFPGTPAAREASRMAATAGQPAPMRLAGAAFLGAEGVPFLEALAADRSVDREVRRAAALHGVLASPVHDALRLIARFRWSWSHWHLPQALADRVAAVTDSAREPVLLELVAAEAPSLQVAAVRALARIGTLDAVEPLRACASSADAGGELSQAVREAIAAIQARLGDVAGRLSVAAVADARGGLSPSPGPSRGAVSPAAPAPDADRPVRPGRPDARDARVE